MPLDLTSPIFQDAEAARDYLEGTRWPDGAWCPHCGSFSVTRLEGKKHRPGVWQCNDCRDQFTVTVGTVFEKSKVPLNKWLAAYFLMCSSKKGVSSHQIHRMLGVTYKTAWFMTHRIREAMKGSVTSPLGGEGQTVEVDETFYGDKKSKPKDTFTSGAGWEGVRGWDHKRAIVSLVERGGRVISFHVPNLTNKVVRPLIVKHASRKSRLNTDEASRYKKIGKEFEGGHGTVRHSIDEYVRGADTTNTVEGFFSIFKRGMVGIYQHCGEQHLQRYVTEFDFRYNHRKVSDAERTVAALKGAEGKRLTYRRTNRKAEAPQP